MNTFGQVTLIIHDRDYILVVSKCMLSVIRPPFEVVKEGRILWDYISILLLSEISGN
jgi:hypothetical protein